jgi:hypothetical protein
VVRIFVCGSARAAHAVPLNLLSFATVAVVAVSVTAPLVGLLWWYDRRVGRPFLRVVVAFGWGAIGASASGLAAARGSLPTSVAATAGIDGLIAVAALLAAALMVRELDAPADGAVVGLAMGFGWAACAAATGAGLAAVVAPVAGAVPAGAAVATAFIDRGVARRLLWTVLAVAGWLAGVAAVHVGVAAVSGLGPRLAMAAGTAAAVVAATLTVVLLTESRILAGELADEVRLGTLPGWAATAIPAFASRVRGRWRENADERAVLARQLTRLAFRKWSLRGLGAEERRLPGLEAVRLRQLLRTELTETERGSDDEPN